jgi:hypothetical protein
MPRNRYTRTVRTSENQQAARQEEELESIARELRRTGSMSTATPAVNEAKQERRNRLANKQRHKPVPASAVAALALVAAVLTACAGGTAAPGELGKDQQILAACDKSAPPASLVQIDGTGSSASGQITGERMATVTSIARQTAICAGQLRVIVFSSSSAGTTTLFDGPLPLAGATANSRLRRVPRLVTSVMTQIRKAYNPAVARLDAHGSDITSQYRLAGEWIGQVGGKARLHLYLLTDGFQTIGTTHVGAKPLTKRQAATLAMRVDVPKLPGASIVVAGLGHVAGRPPTSSVVEGLVAYYDALCHKTTAKACLSVTDYTPEGQ